MCAHTLLHSCLGASVADGWVLAFGAAAALCIGGWEGQGVCCVLGHLAKWPVMARGGHHAYCTALCRTCFMVAESLLPALICPARVQPKLTLHGAAQTCRFCLRVCAVTICAACTVRFVPMLCAALV